jgi:hypothetical protein
MSARCRWRAGCGSAPSRDASSGGAGALGQGNAGVERPWWAACRLNDGQVARLRAALEGGPAEHEERPGNLAASDADQLTAIIKNRLKSIQYRPALIDGFLAQTGLSLEPEPP